jgi:hypothetical protein
MTQQQHTRTLYFPADRPFERLISSDAIDLIQQILQEKEYRLCSKKYMLNDFMHSKRLPGELLNRPADRHSKNYQGFYVYPDDAGDIKNHPFFRGIRWDELHIRKPPFVPKVKSCEDTKYFEEDEPISDIDDTSSDESACDAAFTPDEDFVDHKIYRIHRSPGEDSQLHGPRGLYHDIASKLQGKLDASTKLQTKIYNKKKEKKRPRDKILRDAEIGRQALGMRKKGAFLGYAYRRPQDVFVGFEHDRGRSLLSQRGSQH